MRKTKILGFSVPPELHKKFVSVLGTKHKTKSEFFREILDVYFKESESIVNEIDVAQTLKTYWDLRATAKTQVIIIGLAIIVHNRKILIGVRKNNDEWVDNLSWVFPGGKLKSLEFTKELKMIIKKETGLNIKIQNLIATRIHPDSGFKNIQIVALYFHCVLVDEILKEKPGFGLAQLKWITPSKIFKYFTTSVTDEVTKFLMMIEKSNL